jgi:ankyrin repeat protein
MMYKAPRKLVESLLSIYPECVKSVSKTNLYPLTYGMLESSEGGEDDALPWCYRDYKSYHIDSIKLVLEKFPKTLKPESGPSPLQIGLMSGILQIEYIRLLLSSDPTIAELIDGDGLTPLHLSILHSASVEAMDIITLILEAYPQFKECYFFLSIVMKRSEQKANAKRPSLKTKVLAPVLALMSRKLSDIAYKFPIG